MLTKQFLIILLVVVSINNYGQDALLCVGHHWTEDEGNIMMKEFAKEWEDLDSWEKRAEKIKQGIISGMKLEKMPQIKGNFHATIRKA